MKVRLGILLFTLGAGGGIWGTEPWPPFGVPGPEGTRTPLEAVLDRAGATTSPSAWKAEVERGWLAALGELPENSQTLLDGEWEQLVVSRFFESLEAPEKWDVLTGANPGMTVDEMVAAWDTRVTEALPGLWSGIAEPEAGWLKNLAFPVAEIYKERYRKELQDLFLQRSTKESVPLGPNVDRFEALASRLINEAEMGATGGVLTLKGTSLPQGSLQTTGGLLPRDHQFQKILSEGLAQWDAAESRLWTGMSGWELRAEDTYRKGLGTWESARKELEVAREKWQSQVAQILSEGRSSWENDRNQVQTEAHRSLVALEIRAGQEQAARESRVTTLTGVYDQARALVMDASRNGEYWFDRLTAMDMRQPTESFSWAVLNQWTGRRIKDLISHTPDRQEKVKLKDLLTGAGTNPLSAEDLEILGSAEEATGLGPRRKWTEDYREAAFWADQLATSQAQASKVRDQLGREFTGLGSLDDFQVELIGAQAQLDRWDREVRVTKELMDLEIEIPDPGAVEISLEDTWRTAKVLSENAENRLTQLTEKRKEAEAVVGTSRELVYEARDDLDSSGAALDKIRAGRAELGSPLASDAEGLSRIKTRLSQLWQDQSDLTAQEELAGAAYRAALRDAGDSAALSEYLSLTAGNPNHASNYSEKGLAFISRLLDRETEAQNELATLVGTYLEPGSLAGVLKGFLGTRGGDLRVDQRVATSGFLESWVSGSSSIVLTERIHFLKGALTEFRNPGLFDSFKKWLESPVDPETSPPPCPMDPGSPERLASAYDAWLDIKNDKEEKHGEITRLETLVAQLTPVSTSSFDNAAVAQAETRYREAIGRVQIALARLSSAVTQAVEAENAEDQGSKASALALDNQEDRERILTGFRNRLVIGQNREPAVLNWRQATAARDRSLAVVGALKNGPGPTLGEECGALAPSYRDKTSTALESLLAADQWETQVRRQSARVEFQFQNYVSQVSQFLANGTGPGALGGWGSYIAGAGGLHLTVSQDFRLLSKEPGDPTLTPGYFSQPRWTNPSEPGWFGEVSHWLGTLSAWSSKDPDGFERSMKTWGLALGHLVNRVDQANVQTVPGLPDLWATSGVSGFTGGDEGLDGVLLTDPDLRNQIQGRTSSDRFAALTRYRSWIRGEMARAYETVNQDPVQSSLFQTAAALHLSGELKESGYLVDAVVQKTADYLGAETENQAGKLLDSSKTAAVVASGFLAAAAACSWWNPFLAGALAAQAVAPGADSLINFNESRTFKTASDRFKSLVQGKEQSIQAGLRFDELRKIEVRQTALRTELTALETLKIAAPDLGLAQNATKNWLSVLSDLTAAFQSEAAGFKEALVRYREGKNRYLAGDPGVTAPQLQAWASAAIQGARWSALAEAKFWFQSSLDLTSGNLTSFGNYENLRADLVRKAGSAVLFLGESESALQARSLSDAVDRNLREVDWMNLRWEELMKVAVDQGVRGWKAGEADLEKNFRAWEAMYRSEFETKKKLWETRFGELSEGRTRWVAELLQGGTRSGDPIWAIQQGQSAAAATGQLAFDLVSDLCSEGADVQVSVAKALDLGPRIGSLAALADTGVHRIPRTREFVPGPRGIPMAPGTDFELMKIQARRNLELTDHLTRVVGSQAWDRVSQARDRLFHDLEGANHDFQVRMDRMYQGAGFLSQSGWYRRSSAVGSTAFTTLEEHQTVEGYRPYTFPNLSPVGDRSLSPEAAQTAWDELVSAERKVWGAGGLFSKHLGTEPVMAPGPDWSNQDMEEGFRASFTDPGSGELGRLVGWFEYFKIRSSGGWAEVTQGLHNKKLWDDRGQLFEAPTVRSAVSTALGLAASALGGTLGSMAVLTGIDGLFTAADAAEGLDGTTAWGNWAKRTLAGGLSMGFAFGTSGLDRLVGGLTEWTGLLAKTAYAGGVSLGRQLVSTGVSSIKFENSGLGWDSQSFSDAWEWDEVSDYAGLGMSLAGAGTEALVNGDGVGFLGEKLESYNKVGALAGSLASMGVGYLMSEEAVVNLGPWNTPGFLEMSVNHGKLGFRVGTSGANLGPQSWAGGLEGLGVWAENQQINNKVDGDLRVALRGLSSVPRGPLKELYGSVMAGTTELRESPGLDAQALTTVGPGGIKTIFLGPQDESAGIFDRMVVLAHEARRNGLWDGESGQKAETRDSVLTHMAMAATVQGNYTGGLGSLVSAEADLLSGYESGLVSPEHLAAYVGRFYDPGADFWKLTNDGGLVHDGSGWLRDENSRFVTTLDGNRIGAQGPEAGLLNILFGGTAGKNAGEFGPNQVGAARALLAGSGFQTTGNEGKILSPGSLVGNFGDTLAAPVFVNALDGVSDRAACGGPLAEVFRQTGMSTRAQDRLASLVDAKRHFYFGDRLLFRTDEAERLQISTPFQPDSAYQTSGGQHTGIDLSGVESKGAAGMEAHALFSGKVVAEKFNTTSSGYSAVIEYGFPFENTFYSTGIQAQYMHFAEESPLETGQIVSATEMVGKVGSTGRSDGPHLHYQLMGDLGGQTSSPDSPLWKMYQGRRDRFLSRIGAGSSDVYDTVPSSTRNYWVSNGSLRNFYYNSNRLLDQLGIALGK